MKFKRNGKKKLANYKVGKGAITTYANPLLSS